MSVDSTLRAYRFQLRPRPAQEKQLARRERGEKYAGYAGMCDWLTASRNASETSWLRKGPVHPQQQVLKRLDAAFQTFFANAKAGKKAGYPRFNCRSSSSACSQTLST